MISATELPPCTRDTMDSDSRTSLKDFSVPPCHSLLDSVSLREHLTLRNICVRYRNSHGASWVHAVPPEASAAVSSGQIPCLNRYENIVGHMSMNTMICFPLEEANSIIDLVSILAYRLEPAFRSGRLWAIPGTVKYRLGGAGTVKWLQDHNIVTLQDSELLTRIAPLLASPLSANTVHAAMEAGHYRNTVAYRSIFLYPHNAAMSVGLIGSLHDNQCIDMSPKEENRKLPDMDARTYKDDFIGFICAGHTSHSEEAGRVRRVACSVDIRLLTEDTILELGIVADKMGVKRQDYDNDKSESSWLVFCMGIYCSITSSELEILCSEHRLLSLSGPTTFSLHIDAGARVVVISIASGTLVKQCSNGYWADNIEVYHSSRLKHGIRPVISESGPDQHRACFSAYFNLIPYISSDRAPRPLISSVQTPQAVCLPWCPGDAAVSPCYSFSPMVTTPMYKDVMNDIHRGAATISSYLPGENVTCLFLNMEYNYEDAIIVSKRYVDNGGFSTISMCSYNIPQSENIPAVGSTMCGILYPWWKSPCQPHCSHDSEKLLKRRCFTSRGSPTGIVCEVAHLKSGDVNIKIRSHQQLQRGDKLSMGHGQKGIAVITPFEDMPCAYSSKHGKIVPDIVIAMSSIVTRQTNGVIYEAAKSLSLMCENSKLPAVVQACDTFDVGDDFTVRSGVDGSVFTTLTLGTDGNYQRAATKATLGIVRLFNQTQMSRERHQISHVKVGRNTLRTPGGRARGGGVVWGEMEVQSTSSAGLQWCDDEISERGDRIVGRWCVSCQRLGLLCTCTSEDSHILVKAPYDLVVLDCINAVVYNGSFQYQFSPEGR